METDYQNYVESLSGVSSDEDDISTADSSDESTEEPTTVPVALPRTRNLVKMLYDREVCFTALALTCFQTYQLLIPPPANWLLFRVLACRPKAAASIRQSAK